ncbi:MAG: aldehyde ferredoxin oxidoreductase C-terminal domain-containing protein [Methanobacteriota archaeon]
MVNLKRAFNVFCGIRRKDDTLPERFLSEPLKKGGSTGRVVNLEPMLDEYYEARGWNKKNGIPSKEKLEELGIRNLVDDFKESRIS